MTVDTQNPDTSGATLPEPGSEEAAILALSTGGQPAEAENNTETSTDPEDKAGDDKTDEQEAKADDAEADPDADGGDDPETVEVEYEGEKFVVPPKLKDALLRQSDYSRKMNEVGAVERQAKASQERAELIASNIEKIAEAKAQAVIANADVEFYEKTDWADLIATNPGAYARTQIAYQTAIAARDKALITAQNVEGELSQARSAQIADARNAMFETLQKSLKGWGEDLGAKITRYAISQGFKPEVLQTLTDPQVVIALDKARRFDELQTAKAGLQGKAKDAKAFVKPGNQRRLTGKAEVQARFNKSPTEEDAIRLLNG